MKQTNAIKQAKVTLYYVLIYPCLGDDIFRRWERIKNKQPYYTTLTCTKVTFSLASQFNRVQLAPVVLAVELKKNIETFVKIRYDVFFINY